MVSFASSTGGQGEWLGNCPRVEADKITCTLQSEKLKTQITDRNPTLTETSSQELWPLSQSFFERVTGVSTGAGGDSDRSGVNSSRLFAETVEGNYSRLLSAVSSQDGEASGLVPEVLHSC